jgi:hypothetical protein
MHKEERYKVKARRQTEEQTEAGVCKKMITKLSPITPNMANTVAYTMLDGGIIVYKGGRQ